VRGIVIQKSCGNDLVVLGGMGDNPPPDFSAVFSLFVLGCFLMAVRRGRRLLVALLLVAVVAAGVLGVLAIPGMGPKDMMAARWEQQLATVKDEDALAHVRKIARLGEPGIPVLVTALASDRASVAGAGRVVLFEEIERWRWFRADVSSRRVAILAEALAKASPHLGPVAQKTAADLATQILLWPSDAKAIDRRELVSNCETILHAKIASRLQHGPATTVAVFDMPSTTKSTCRPKETWPLEQQENNPLREMPTLPGGGLPVEMAQIASPPSLPKKPKTTFGRLQNRGSNGHGKNGRMRSQDARKKNLSRAEGDSLHSSLSPPRPLHPGVARRLIPATPPSGPLRKNARPKSGNLLRENQAEIRDRDQLRMTEPTAGSLVQLSDLDVMRLLHAEDGETKDAAKRELVRRGFDPLRLRLAHYLTHPDPAMRAALAESLPVIHGIDQRLWLMTLAKDPNPTVRLAAATVIATTSDVDMKKELRQLETQETNPKVRQMLRQAIQPTSHRP